MATTHAQTSWWLAAMLLVVAACGDDIATGGSGGDASGGGATGGGGAAEGGTSPGGAPAGGAPAGGGGGGATPCDGPADCPNVDPCLQPVCVAGSCGVTFTPLGTPLADQVEGDCLLTSCDGAGNPVELADDDDFLDDGSDCTIEGCARGEPTSEPAVEGVMCDDRGGTFCNDSGDCVECLDESDCLDSTDCEIHSCELGACTTNFVAAGTPLPDPVDADCRALECDGAGLSAEVDDNGDVFIDLNPCTDDLCDQGVPENPVTMAGTACGADDLCDGAGACVDCLGPTDCPSLNCESNVCLGATCVDGIENGSETALDCGGSCPPCSTGQPCLVGLDCVGGICAGSPLICQATCADGIQDQDESDVDCGGVCPACVVGQGCNDDGDCASGVCSASNVCTCSPNDGVLLISELRTRGPTGAADDFVELYNAGSVPVTFDSGWTLESRSEGAPSYTVRYTGAGQVIAPRQHLLLVGSTYSGAAAGDALLASGFADESSVVVRSNGVVIDALCMSCGANNFTTHTCEGTVVPLSGCANNVDRSVERLPGGALGNCVDTNDNAADFNELTPANPQNLASPAVP